MKGDLILCSEQENKYTESCSLDMLSETIFDNKILLFLHV